MTRDELTETMARAGVRAGIQSEHLSRCAATFMASAIEAAGLAIVPVEATTKMAADAWGKVVSPEKAKQGIARLGPGPGVTDVYRAMIEAGRI